MRRLRTKHTLAAAVAGLAVAGGSGAALAASSGTTPSPSAFFDAVAKHLGISSEKLEEATKAAAIDQVDAALAAGRITEAQAAELKERIQAGDLPFGGFGLFDGPRGGLHVHGLGAKLDAAAAYLDLTEAQLRERLDGGDSLAEVAEAEGKSVDGLKRALLADAEERLDAAVADGSLTRAQADEALERLRSHIDDLVTSTPPGPRGGGHRFFAGPPMGISA